MASAPQLVSVVEALDAAFNWSTSPAVRKEATAFLEQVKAADPRTAVQLGIALASSDRADHVRLFGVQLLQIAVLGRWGMFTDEEHQQLSKISFDLLLASTQPGVDRSFRSKSAALLADIVRQAGPSLWEELLPALVNLASSGPAHAETAALVLQFLPEDITVYNEDLDGDKRRQWLVCLTATLPQVLPFICSLLETNFTAALSAVQRGDVATGRSHAAAVSAALSSACAYAEWAPVAALGAAKLVDACGYLLSASEFRTGACDFLKVLGARRRQQEDPEAFDAAMASLFSFTIVAARTTLQHLAPAAQAPQQLPSDEVDYDPAETDFAQGLCEVFVALTPTNLQRLVHKDDNALPQLLEVLLEYFRHNLFGLHAQALPLWTILLRESAAAVGAPLGYQGMRLPKSEREHRSSWCLVPPNHCVALLEVVVRRLQQTAQGGGISQGEDELLGSSTASDYAQYRARLLDVIRLVAAQQPLAAACKASAMLDAALALTAQNQNPDAKVIASVEAAQTFLECTLVGIPEASMSAAASFSTSPGVLCDELSLVLEGMLKQLLDLSWPRDNGALMEIHAHLLDNLAPYCKHNPSAAGRVVAKIFALLRELPPVAMGAEPLGRPEKAEERLPRLQACTSVLRLCRAAAPALKQHLRGMVESVTQVAQEAQAHRGNVELPVTGETILLGEALICVAAASGPQEEAMVLEWLFAPVRQKWASPAWQQRTIQDAPTFSRLLAHAPGSPEEADFWLLYHAVMLFERCLRRVPVPPPPPVGPQGPPVPGVGPAGAVVVPGGGVRQAQQHQGAVHLHWILPPLLQLLRWIHALWRPDVRGFLPPAASQALDVGVYEQNVLLGFTGPALGQGQGQGQAVTTPASAEQAVIITRRNWLKGLRDNGYGFLGMAAANARETLFSLPPPTPQQLQTACTESLAPMEVRHLKLLLKLVVSCLARTCPREQWGPWLGPLLPALLQHCGGRLAQAWAAKTQQGQAAQAGAGANPLSMGGLQGAPSAAAGAKDSAVRNEMYEDKMLRDLSREYCALLMALPRLPPAVTGPPGGGLSPSSGPPQQQPAPMPGPQGTPSATSPMPTEIAGRPDSLFWFLLEVQPEAMMAVLSAGIESMSWPDSDAAHKGIAFCTGVCSLPELLLSPGSPAPAAPDAGAAGAGPLGAGAGAGGGAGAGAPMAPAQQQQLSGYLREAVGRSMFSACITALTMESNATAQAEVLGLMRDIYLRLSASGLSAGPREVLLSLPCMSLASLESFDASLKRSGSAKEQSKVLKSLLVGLGGGRLLALAAQRNTTAITNVSGYVKRLSHDAQVASQGSADNAAGSSIGLASLVPGTKP